MAICYFDNNYEKKYNCKYEKVQDGIMVVIDYDITDEIPSENGVKTFKSNTVYDNRDILIVDSTNKINYLLKSAYYCRYNVAYGSLDDTPNTKFKSSNYLYHKDYNKLSKLQEDSNISKFRVYTDLINELIGMNKH